MLIKFSRLFYGWRMIAVGSALRILGGGLYHYGFTVFFLPISQDLGLTRAALSLVFSLARAQGAFEAPVTGYFMDRFGPRPLIITAIIMTSIGHMLLSGVHSYFTLILVYMGVVSLSFQAGFMDAPMLIANTWFIRRRALAMTLISASMGLGGTLFSPLLASAVRTWGWRQAALLAGIGLLIVGIPLASLVRRSPESMDLLPDGDSLRKREGDAAGSRRKGGFSEETDFTVRKAMRTSAYWMIVLATMVRVAGFDTIMVHFIPIMVWKGVDERQAAYLLATYAFFSLPAHLLLGWLADYVNKPRLMALSMLVATVALLSLIFGQDKWALWLFAVLFTTAEVIFPMTWATVGDFFGRKSFGTIRGTMSFFYMWGSVSGPVVAGAVFDRTQSYGPMLPWLAVLFLVGAALYGLMVRPTPPPPSTT